MAGDNSNGNPDRLTNTDYIEGAVEITLTGAHSWKWQVV